MTLETDPTLVPAVAVAAPVIPAAPKGIASLDDVRSVAGRLRDRMREQVMGRDDIIELVLVALFADGHVLLEDYPGSGKTTLAKSLGHSIIDDLHHDDIADFRRVQFTPDLLPSDVTGVMIFDTATNNFTFRRGPLFAYVVLVDEINRTSPKVQSALLEAMGERQVTVGRQTYALPPLFLVMATQNPIEQEGTFPLPEAQLDRFLMHVRIGYPEAAAESEILRLARDRARDVLQPATRAIERMPQADVFAARTAVLDLHVAPQVERYLVELVLASRDAARYDAALARRIAWGASPRGSIALERCARARAWLAGRDFVTPDDVRAIAPDVLRHRVLPSYEATAEGWDGERLVAELLRLVPLP